MREYVETMTKQAEQLRYWLSCSYLVKDAGYDLQTAAETYDEMNDNTEHQDALKLLGLWKETV
jgi:hypothetical protein